MCNCDECSDGMLLDEHPFVIEDENGNEIAEADSPEAAKDAARFLIESGENEPPLIVRARHSGATQTAERGPHGVMFSYGAQRIGDGWPRMLDNDPDREARHIFKRVLALDAQAQAEDPQADEPQAGHDEYEPYDPEGA